MSGGPCKRGCIETRLAHNGSKWGRYCRRCGWWAIHPRYPFKEAVPRA